MSTDFIRLTFSAGEQTGSALIQDASCLFEQLNRLHAARARLLSSGLQGAFLDDLEYRCQALLRTLETLCAESDAAGRDLVTTVGRARQTDAECAALFDARLPWFEGLFGPGGGIPGGFDGGGSSPNAYGLFNGAQDLNKFSKLLGEPREALVKRINQYLLDTNPEQKQAWMRWLNQGGYRALGSGFQLAEGVVDALAEGDPSELVKGIGSAGAFYLLGKGKPFTFVDKFIGGAVDAAVTGDVGQLAEGAIKGGIYLIPGVDKVLAVNAGVQLLGHGLTAAVDVGADVLAGGNPADAAELRAQAEALNAALDRADLDNVVDSVAENITDIFQGQGDVGSNLAEIGESALTAVSGYVDVARRGAQLVGTVGRELGERAPEVLNAVGQGIDSIGSGFRLW